MQFATSSNTRLLDDVTRNRVMLGTSSLPFMGNNVSRVYLHTTLFPETVSSNNVSSCMAGLIPQCVILFRVHQK